MSQDKSRVRAEFREEMQEFKRRRIIEEALRLFYERGYDGTSVDALAATIGVTKPFIYSYFENKRAILEAVHEQSARRVHGYIASAVNGEGPPAQKLQRFLRDFTIENIKHQIASGVYLQEEKNLSDDCVMRIRDIERSFNDLLTGLIKQGCDEGVFRVEEPKLAALSIAGMVRWVHRWYSPTGRFTPEQLADEISKLGLNLVGFDPTRH